MKLQVVGCSHHNSSVAVREQLAFNADQAKSALVEFRQRFPATEAVLLSTCNRVEFYLASESDQLPSHHDVAEFLAHFHGLNPVEFFDELFERTGGDAIRHLFTVAASLDSMVVGEAQILSQVKQAYEQATVNNSTGPLTHSAFQAAIRVAKRVTTETSIHRRRVSVPSVAVADFAKQFFVRFDDKVVLVIGAGEMGEETVRYLIDEGAQHITIVNRNRGRAEQLATQVDGVVEDWERLPESLARADLVVSTTGAAEPIVTFDSFAALHRRRNQRPLFVLDLAVPRDFAPEIGDLVGVYLYSVDDLQKTCNANRTAREKEWPRAERIIEEETARFMDELNHRAAGPIIRRFKAQADEVKSEELRRLFNKLDMLDDRTQAEIERAFNRLVNKLLHPPLESIRDHAATEHSHGLLDALRRLFKID